MHLLTRYILFELVRVFVITLVGMTVVLLLAGVAQEAIRQGLGLLPIVRLIPYLLPNALVFAVPGTILFATCSVYGRMAAENEVVAAKSVGISPFSFLYPGFVLAFFISLGAVWLNDISASWGRAGAHRVVVQSVEQIAYGMLRTRRAYSTSQFSINVDRVEGRKLIAPTLTIHSSDGSASFTLTADEAELWLNDAKDALTISLKNSKVDWGDDWYGDFPGEESQDVPLDMASQKGALSSSSANCRMQEVPQEIAEEKEMMHSLRQQFAAEAALEMVTGDFMALTGPKWNEHHHRLREAQIRLYRLELAPWRRWANGFSCLFFVLVGAPLALRLRNADIWTSFGLCFLPILLLYYPLLMYGLDRAKCGALPPYSVWLGNLVLLAGGIWLVVKVRRH